MGKGAIYLGIAIILFSLWLLVEVGFFIFLVFFIFGLALIIYNREEDKVEQRKDLVKAKPKTIKKKKVRR